MQSYRRLSKLPISKFQRAISTTPARKMAFLQRSFANEPSSFTSLFRLLDDYDTYNSGFGGAFNNKSHSNNNSNHHRSSSVMKTFSPKFDVRELEDVYELHGELPGIDQKDIEIEFIDAQTLSVKGRTERTHQSGTPPAGAVEAPKATGALLEGAATSETTDNNSHNATVEDEDAAATTEAGSTTTEVAKTNDKQQQSVAETKQNEPNVKYWLSERSVGEFSRHFTFPVRVNQEGVKASMNNGILNITVPKAKKQESRKITIS